MGLYDIGGVNRRRRRRHASRSFVLHGSVEFGQADRIEVLRRRLSLVGGGGEGGGGGRVREGRKWRKRVSCISIMTCVILTGSGA